MKIDIWFHELKYEKQQALLNVAGATARDLGWLSSPLTSVEVRDGGPPLSLDKVIMAQVSAYCTEQNIRVSCNAGEEIMEWRVLTGRRGRPACVTVKKLNGFYEVTHKAQSLAILPKDCFAHIIQIVKTQLTKLNKSTHKGLDNA